MQKKQKKFYFKRFSLRTKFYSTAFGILAILVLMAYFTNHYIKKTSGYHYLLTNVKELAYLQSELRRAEKNFMLIETINPDFYATGKSAYLERFSHLSTQLYKKLSQLQSNNIIQELELNNKLAEISDYFFQYKNIFQKITQLTLQRGFKDYGLIGKMRERIHYVEDIINANPKLDHYKDNMLMLRRHEKDYLLRKDVKYKDKFMGTNLGFIQELKADNQLDTALIKQLIAALHNYQSIFFKVIAKESEIGADEEHALMKALKENSDEITPIVNQVNAIISEESEQEINRAISTLLILIGIFSLVIILIIFRLAASIITSVKYLKAYITRLGNGELPGKIQKTSNDEISDMIESVNNLTQNLKNTRNFAIEVGNGNFKTEINVFNNKGDLGKSLVDMRKRLLKVDVEREKRQKEEKIRNWHVEGIAKFGELLRNNSNNLDNLSYSFISELIKYLEINQGGLFICYEDKQNNPYFLLKAAYAYDRNKFLHKRVEFQEGLIGRCANEKKTIYMTNLPENYLRITSGLGGKKPGSLLLLPLILNDVLYGVIELASFEEFAGYKIEFVEKLSESIASSISNIRVNEKTNVMVKELQEQTRELTQQEEELRQNVEELQATREEMERKETEFNGITSAINNSLAAFKLDMNGNFLQANNKYLSIVNMPLEKLKGKVHKQLLQLTSNELQLYNKNFLNLSNGVSFKTFCKYKNQDKVYYELFTPVKNRKGDYHKIIAFTIDVSEVQSSKEMKKLKNFDFIVS